MHFGSRLRCVSSAAVADTAVPLARVLFIQHGTQTNTERMWPAVQQQFNMLRVRLESQCYVSQLA